LRAQKGNVMPTAAGKNNHHKEATIVVTKKVKSREKDPLFVKKTKAAEAFLRKHGLPLVYTK
jgi:hypothetical protein